MLDAVVSAAGDRAGGDPEVRNGRRPLIDLVVGPSHLMLGQLADTLRDDDRRELLALGFPDAARALWHAAEVSRLFTMALVDGVPAAAWGCAPLTMLSTRAILWMGGTPEVDRHPKLLLKMSRNFVAWASANYPVLECYVDLRYEKAKRWVTWLGFEPARRHNELICIYERRA